MGFWNSEKVSLEATKNLFKTHARKLEGEEKSLSLRRTEKSE